MRDTEGQRLRQGEGRSPRGGLDVGLDPQTGSLPGPGADAQPLNHPGAPRSCGLCHMAIPHLVKDFVVNKNILHVK